MGVNRDVIAERIRALGPWFHNMDIGGVRTAPGHFLGDYPMVKWRHVGPALPADLSGRTVLDIGCNAGFYAMEMKRRGAAHVLGIDEDDAYLAQARFAAEVAGLAIEYRRMSVYDVGSLGMRFDVVLFMGVLYHLRHPLLALDLVSEHAVDDLLVFQSMLRGRAEVAAIPEDRDFTDLGSFEAPGHPVLSFIEHRYAGDPTNWWVPNRACAEAMLRSSGFEIIARIEDETFLCRRSGRPAGQGAAYPARGEGR